MAAKTEKVKISKDGNSIEFIATDSMPISPKKFRASPEVEAFYRFVNENDIRKEASQIIERISKIRKVQSKSMKKASKKTH